MYQAHLFEGLDCLFEPLFILCFSVCFSSGSEGRGCMLPVAVRSLHTHGNPLQTLCALAMASLHLILLLGSPLLPTTIHTLFLLFAFVVLALFCPDLGLALTNSI